MKKLFLLSVLTLTAFSLSGCVIFHLQNTINDDGSGSVDLYMSVSPGVQEAFLELQAMGAAQVKTMDIPDLSNIDQGELERLGKEHGVRVKKFEKERVDGRQILNISLDFDDLKGLSYIVGRILERDGSSGDGVGIFEASDGNLVLRSTSYDFPAAPSEKTKASELDPAKDPAQMDPEQMQKQMAIMGKLMSAMSELDISLKITVPGEIVSSSAPVTEGRTSIWVVNASNMMTMDKNMDPKIVFSGKGLKIKPIKE